MVATTIGMLAVGTHYPMGSSKLGSRPLLKKICLLEWTVGLTGLVLQLSAVLGAPSPAGILPPACGPIPTPGWAAVGVIVLTLAAVYQSARTSHMRALPFALWCQIILAGAATILSFPRYLALLVFTAVSKGFILQQSRRTLLILFAAALSIMFATAWMHAQQLFGGGPEPPPVEPFIGQASFWLSFSFDTGMMVLFCYLILSETRARARAEDLMEQVEELTLSFERQRIGRELHDSLGHRLVSLALQLDIAAKCLKKQDPEHAQGAIQLARSVADKSLVEIREAVANIRGSNFDMETAMLELANEVQGDSGILLQLTLDPRALEILSLEAGRHVFSITKECLNNVRKHARAQQATVSLTFENTYWLLSIEDNGIGRMPGATEGFGMASLRERAHVLNAKLTFESRAGLGTRVTVTGPAPSGRLVKPGCPGSDDGHATRGS